MRQPACQVCVRGWVCGSAGVLLGHWFLGLSECSLCGSVLRLAGQVPGCDLSPSTPQTVGLSWAKHKHCAAEPPQLSTQTCSERGAALAAHWTLTARVCVTHSGGCEPVHVSVDKMNPTHKFRFYLTALSVLCEVQTVFACYRSENLSSDVFAFLIYCCHWRLCIASSLVPKSGDEPLVFIFL